MIKMRAILSVFFLIAAATAGFCQSRDAYLFLHLSASGRIQAHLQGPFRPSVPVVREVMRRLSDGEMRSFNVVSDADDPDSDDRTPATSGIWSDVYATYREGSSRTGLMLSGVIRLEPLFTLLRPLKMSRLLLRIDCPRAATTQFAGPFEAHDTAFAHHLTTEYSSSDLQNPVVPIHYAFGYRPVDLSPIFGMLGVLLLLPIGLAIWMRHRAFQAAGADAATAWFRYSRFLQWASLGFNLVWIPCLLLVQPLQIINFWLGVPSSVIRVGVLECFVALPPLLVGAACACISYPVSVRVRGSSRTRWELVWQTFLSQARVTVPIALVVTGISAWQQQHHLSIVFFGLALCLPTLCTQLLVKSQNIVLEAITEGELRDRVFALAQKAGVTVQQLVFFKTGKENIANAFAVQGNVVVLTEYLLQHLSRREVDAIVAHELAHLRHRHPARLKSIGLLSIILPCASLLLWDWSTRSQLPIRYFLASGLVLLGLLVLYYKSRQFEGVADREAAALTGDPEGLITGLLKLKQLNLTPLEWGKWEGHFLTHPSTLRRAETLAREGGLPHERLQEILQRAADDDDHYPLPPTILQPDAVYTTRWKMNYLVAKGRILTVAEVTLSLGAACAIRAIAPPAPLLLYVGVGAFLVSCCLYILFVVAIAHAGFVTLKQRLAVKLGEKETMTPGAGGIFVGLSPAARPRLYGGFSDWDMGFLYLDGQRLTFVGEQAQFSLDRSQVGRVSLGPGLPAWYPAPRLYMVWKDTASQEDTAFHDGHTLSFRAAEYAYGWQSRMAAAHLFDCIQVWQESSSATLSAAPLPYDFGTPSIGQVTSVSPTILRSPTVFFHNLKLPALLSIGASIVAGLPFRLSGGGYGWLVLAGVILLTAVLFLPYWKYRDPKSATN